MTGVLLMSHGSPDSLDHMEEYLRHIMTRRPPTPAFVEEMKGRYRQIGGRSPLLEITRAQAAALSKKLGVPVYVGMRHAPPFIRDSVEEARREGVERLIGLPLAPHFAEVSVGAYHRALRETGIPCALVREWYLEPSLLDYWRRTVADRPVVLFTAHSIPVEGAGPYAEQLAEMIRAIAPGPHAFAYQSKSPSPIAWLGPEVPDVLRTLRGKVSVAPIGFVADHVEVLYDLDILHRRQAEELGLEWERLPMPNLDPLFIDALASVAGKHL